MESSTANEGEIVHVWVATTTPDQCAAFAQRLSGLLQGTAPDLPGFLRGQVMEADDCSSVVVLSHWESRHLWAQAEWNEEVGRTITELFQSGAKIVDSIYYVRSVARSSAGPHP